MSILAKQLRLFRQCTAGTALIEAALVLPIAIFLMLGLFDFGRAYMTLATAQKSLRDGGRYLSMLPASAVCGWGLTKARNVAVFGNLAGTGSPLLANWTTADVTLQLPTSCASETLAVIQLSASVPYTAFAWQIVGMPATITLTAQHEERWIGQ